jgi:xanthine dehydrogenase/oxidase
MPNVLTYVDHTDLPSPKANVWGPAVQDEFFFAVDHVTSNGGIIGAIVATNKLDAQKAARAVKIEYEDLPRILTVEEVSFVLSSLFHVILARAQGSTLSSSGSRCELVPRNLQP